ncbi:MAG TPA: XRE family transcriptional regulator [Chitinophagaceae bacterium]|jgi:transcriptional regulator with XRE-family HTH domain|nr:XRE family transcriptional regulator [Chitinophagaceae bacterium]
MPNDPVNQICSRLRSLRKERQMTLQDLAGRAGVSKGLVSQIENGRTLPSLPVLTQLIHALQLDFSQFFSGISAKPTSYLLCKKNGGEPFEKEATPGFYYQRLFTTRAGTHQIDFVQLTVVPGAHRTPVRTDAWEFKYLLEGAIRYGIGEERLQLEAGDALYFDGRQLHHLENNGTGKAVLLIAYFFHATEELV